MAHASHLLSAKVQFLTEMLVVDILAPEMTRLRDRSLYDVEYESISHGPYRLGSAWLTHGGNLPISRGIIHVAAMDRNGKSKGLETIRECIWSALELAVKKEIESVAFGAMGTAPRVVERETGSIISSATGSSPG
jgi:O-acetyl-ADP-ribose deacetylase (regulator of RNase III)